MVKTPTNAPRHAKHLSFIVADLVCLAVSFSVSYFLKFHKLGIFNSPSWRTLLAMVLLWDVLITIITEPYHGIYRRNYWEDIGATFKLVLINFLVSCVIFYLFKIGTMYSRGMLLVTFALYLGLSLIVKFLLKRWKLSRRNHLPAGSVRRMLVATCKKNARSVESAVLANDINSIEVVGFCIVDCHPPELLLGRPASVPAGIVSLANQTMADEILVAVDPSLLGKATLEELVEDGLTVRLGIVEALGIHAETEGLSRAGVIKTVDFDRYSFGATQLLYQQVKRAFDILFGLLGCVITIPVALLVKLAYVCAGDWHPVLYQQRRIGFRGEPFQLYKFRSMVWDADKVLEDILKDPEARAEWERDQKLSNDPRITPIGRFLRRTSIDELPQFLNVLIGQMSLVGPRPLVPGELEEHHGKALYNKVKPGITGWWGCNGRSNIDYRERLELEYYYIKHCSLYLDVLCIMRTIVTVLKRDGAQ